MMTKNDFESCDGGNDVFCNVEGGIMQTKLAVLLKRKKKSYNHNIDCVHDYSYCKSEPPVEACVFSPQDIEAWEREGDKDIYTSDYIGEV